MNILTASECISAPKSYLSVEDAQAALSNNEINYPLIIKTSMGNGIIGNFYS